MRFAALILSIFVSSPVLGDAASEHLNLIAYPSPGCGSTLLIHGLLPNGHGEDRFSIDDVISTQINKDAMHMSRLFHVIESSEWILSTTREMANWTYVPTRPAPWIKSWWEDQSNRVGKEYPYACFGVSLPQFLEHDAKHDPTAKQTRAVLQELNDVMRKIAYTIKYLHAWRIAFKEVTLEDGNRSFKTWIEEQKRTETWDKTKDTLRTVTARTETELLRHPSKAFAPTQMARHAISADNWDERFPTRHLPVIGMRALEYLRLNREAHYVRGSAVFSKLLSRLSAEVVAYDATTHRLLEDLKP